MGDLDRFRSAEERLWRSVGVTPTERFVRLRTGCQVRVQEVGSGPPVLFVHGVSVAGSSWCLLAAALQDFRCILLDRPGCGMSDAVPGGSLRDLAAVLASADALVCDVLDAVELDRAHVAATSYGGLFAFRAAAAHPDRVDRLVEYSWLMGAPMDRVPVSMRIAAIPGLRAMTTRMPITRGLVKALLSQIGLRRAIDTGAFTGEMVDWTVSLMRDTNTLANELRAAPKIVTPIKGLNRQVLLTDDVLARIVAPTLFLWGDEDPNGSTDVARSLVRRLPDADLEIVWRAGHAPWIDDLARCANRTRAFLSA